MKLDAIQRIVLRAFAKLDPKGEYQYNTWSPDLESAIKSEYSDAGISYTGGWERELQSLTRRGALTAEGRGRWRQFGITQAGLEAIDG